MKLSRGLEPIPLATLAAAYAEAGRFAEAVEIAQRLLAGHREKRRRHRRRRAPTKPTLPCRLPLPRVPAFHEEPAEADYFANKQFRVPVG